MHDRGFCCHGDINSRLPAQTHNWVRIERWRGAVKIPLMKVEHQSCCRRLQSTHNQMKCLAERKQDRASYSLKTNPTFENGPRDNLTCFCFCFFLFFFFLSPLLHSLEPPRWLFFRLYSKLVSVHLALILLSQAWIYTLSLYSSPQMMEINSHKRSGPLWQAEPPAQGSSGPFERQTKAKNFCPLCLLLKSHWKSAHAFSNLRHSSFIDALFFFFLGGRGGGFRQGDVLAWRRVRDGNGVGPLDKTSPPPSLFTATSGITNNTKSKTWWVAWSYMLAGGSFFFFFPFFVSTSFRNTTKSWSFVGRADCTSRRLLLTAMSVGNPAGCSISITQALSWNTPPSINTAPL